MNREEAIYFANCLKNNYTIDLNDMETFCDMAIKALAQEPTTKNDLGVDCVARQDVERYIEGFINEYTPKEELEFINLELDGLKHIPSVTPQELRKGKWLGDSAGYKCSICGHDLLEIAHSIDYIDFKKPYYCPNCGADMREVEE